MKFAVIILAVAVAGAFAQDDTTTPGIPPFVCTSSNALACTFQELGHKIKYHATKLGGKLATVGTAVVQSAVEQGKGLLGNAAQALLGTLVNHLNSAGVGKRDMALLGKIKEHLSNGFDKLNQLKEGLHAAFKKAYTKLTGMIADNSALKNIDEDLDKKVDTVVAQFNKDNKKGFFGMAKTVADKIKAIFQAGMEKMKAKFGKKMDERAVLSDWLGSWKDSWNKVTTSLSNTFKPHLDTLKQGITDLANKAKEHGSNLVNAAKGHFDTLKTKLSGHVDKLKEQAAKLGIHGKNALTAVKDALTSIATQSTGHVKDALNEIIKTGLDAANVAAGHVAGAVAGN